MIASVAKYSAWRSRWTIWEDAGAGFSPNFAQTYSSIAGSMKENVPTAPESFPVLIVSLARAILSRFRSISPYQRAIFSPKVIGSAWIPCDLPIMSVSLWVNAFFLIAASRRSRSSIRISAASRSRSPSEVSRISEEVSPDE